MTVNIPENNEQANLEQEKQQQPEQKNQQIQPIQKQQEPRQEEKKEDGTQEDPNWKAFREGRKKDRAEREAAIRKAEEKELEIAALKAAMEAAFAKSSPVNTPEYAQYSNTPHQVEETEDERIEKKVKAAIAEREAAAEKIRQEREQQEYPTRLNQTYSDFSKVISQENLDYLDYHYPEISRPLQRLPEGFDKWSDIYHTVKKLVPNLAQAKKDGIKAEANFNKPKSISSTGITQPGEAVGSARLTEERRASNWERMQRIMKGVS